MTKNGNGNWSECPHCNHEFKIFAVFIGNKYTCKNCKKQFVVHGKDESVPDEINYKYNEYSDLFIGKLAVSYNFISTSNFKKALKLKSAEEKSGYKTTLAEVFYKYDIISPEKMEILQKIKHQIKINRMKKRFGTIALAGNYLSQEDILKGLEVQQRELSLGKKRKIGDVFIELGLLTENSVLSILEKQNKIDVMLPNIDDIIYDKDEIVVPDALINENSIQKESDKTGEPKATFMPGLELIISSDNLSADIRKSSGNHSQITIADIKKELTSFGIIHGIIEDSLLDLFINEDSLETDTFQIASGKNYKEGKNSSVNYYFDTDYLTAGRMKKNGIIDFKDRGHAPLAKNGDVLALKTPLEKGEDGIDINGNIIYAPELDDIAFLCGSGSELSEDSLKIIATCDGFIKKSMDGVISVVKEYHIKGDVGYETGHVNFDGTIMVDGTIQSGFSVRGVDLKAKEIQGGEIILSGDLEINGGIIDSEVMINGNVKASYIKNSRIISYGGILVVNEILDTSIDSCGECRVLKGNIISSEITAGGGIVSVDIGTKSSKSCTLKVGESKLIQDKIETLNLQVEKKMKKIEKLKSRKEKYTDWLVVMQSVMDEVLHEKERAIKDKESVTEMLEKYSTKKSKRKLPHGKRMLDDLNKKIKVAGDVIDDLVSDKQDYQVRIKKLPSEINTLGKEINLQNVKMESLKKWDMDRVEIPNVKVYGLICEKTSIYGKQSSIKLKDDYRNVTIKEINKQTHDRNYEYNMQIVRN